MEKYRILSRHRPPSSLIIMKTLRVITLLIWGCSNVVAQQITTASDLASLSVHEAEELINHTADVQIHWDIVSAALSSRRIDLIKLCFENNYTRVRLFTSVTKFVDENLQDESFRDEIVLMMLKSKSPFWPHDDPFTSSNVLTPGSGLVEPFIATIKRNFPDLPLSYDLISTRAARLKLAGELAAVIEKSEQVISPPSAERPMRRGVPPADPQSDHQDVQSMKTPSPEKKANGTITQRVGTSWELLVAGVCLLFIVKILIWRWKSKSAR
jgi:hypothetical protein